MIILDYKTLERLAELICGDKIASRYCDENFSDCPFYRKGYQLPTFFRSAGLKCPDHNGDTRKWWTLERLEYYNKENLIKNVLERFADPKEYGDMCSTNLAINELNNLIAAEGIKVELKGVKPVIINKEAVIPNKESSIISLHKIDFDAFITDEALTKIINNRWRELEKCLECNAFLSAIILMGSILEGVLLHIIEKNEKIAKSSNKAPKRNNKVKPIAKWTLYDLIRVAHDCKWLDKDIKDFNHSLRNYRNLVHPRKQREEEFYPDEDTCEICLKVVNAALNDIKNQQYI